MRSPDTSALELLRRATRFHRCVADADRLAIVGKPPSLAGYMAYLGRMYGFEAPLESALNVAPGLASRLDLAKRVSATTLGMDLCALGFPASDLLSLPHCGMSIFRSLPEALGWLYVSEANRSGHQMFRTYLARELPAVLRGSTISVPRTTSAEWAQLAALLDEVTASDPCAIDAVVDAAIQGFDCEHLWLRPGTPSGTQMRDALRVAEERLKAAPRRPWATKLPIRG